MRARRPFIAAGAAALLVVVAAGRELYGRAEPTRSPRRAVYTVFEGGLLNVYARSVEPASSREHLLISEDARLGNARPAFVIGIRISPAGDRIAYWRLYRPDGRPDGRVFLVDAWGRGKTQVIERAQDLFWSPDGTRIIYSVPGPEPVELPNDPLGPGWRLLDLKRGRQELLAGPEAGFLWFGDWLADRPLFIKAGAFSGFGQPSLVVVDLRTRQWTERPVDADLDNGHARLRVSPTGARIVIAVSTMDSACEVFEITRKGELGRKLLASPHHRCGDLQWNTDDEFFYGKESQPANGVPRAEGIAAHGYYGELSVWRYRFGSRSEGEVVASHEQAVYRFQGLLRGRGIVVSNESARRSPHHILELRRLDGSHPVRLRSSDREMMLVGWLP